MNIIMLQLPYIEAESMEECKEFYEKLLYLLHQMTKDMKTIEELKAEVAATQLSEKAKEVFYQVLDTANVASLSEEDRIVYESNLKAYRDTMSCIRFAEYTGRTEGREEGREEGMKEGMEKRNYEIAKSLKQQGVSIDIISKSTGLSVEEIEKL